LVTGAWNSLDIPLSYFSGLTSREALAQMIISGSSPTVYLDNVYFYYEELPATPEAPAPDPTIDEAIVISLFSNVYTDADVDTWSADWDNAAVEELLIFGNDVMLYTDLVTAGIEFATPTIDLDTLNTFHMDIWTADPVNDPAVFKIKLVDFGADGAFAGDDDAEHELTFSANSDPALQNYNWLSFDISLDDFTGLNTTAHLAQLIISGDPNTVYVDNVYFYYEEPAVVPTGPETPAPVPGYAAADVISLFSNEYSNVTVDTWSTEWDDADVTDVQIAGDDMKRYSDVVFAGIEFVSETIDAAAMTNFHMDLWTANPTADPVDFKIKLVDFGANGVWDGGGDDVEHELTFTAASSPALATGEWISFDIPLGFFNGLVTRGHLAQLIFAGTLGDFYVDNILFYSDGSGTVPTPEVGSLGVFTDNTQVNRSLVLGETAQAYVWVQTLVEGNIEPFEGENVLSWSTANIGWFGAGIQATEPFNLINFVDGFLYFMIQIPADVSFQIGITDTWGNENYVDFPANETTFGLVRDGTWGQASIPVSDIRGENVDLQTLSYGFAILEENGTQCEFAIDDIYWLDGN
jgi:hypothetical protein